MAAKRKNAAATKAKPRVVAKRTKSPASRARAADPAVTRERVIRAALKEFSRVGFEKTSLDRIAAKANVTKGAIYAHFRSKDHLFAALMEIHVEDEIAADEIDIGRVFGGNVSVADAVPALLTSQLGRINSAEKTAFARLYFEFLARTLRNDQIAVLRSIEARFGDRGEAFIVDLRRRGFLDDDLDIGAIQILWSAIINGMMIRRLVGRDKIDSTALAKGLGRILTLGMLPMAERARRD